MNDAPTQGSASQSGPAGTDSFFDNLRRIDVRRSPDGWIGGVCSGLAARLGLDPIVIRAAFVLLGLLFGLGLLVYLAAWVLIPDTDDQTHLERGMRQGDGTSIVLLVVAAVVAFSSIPWWSGGFFGAGGWFGWWFAGLAILALMVWWLWTAWEGRESPGRVAGGTTPPAPGAGEPTAQPGATPYAGATAYSGTSAYAGGEATEPVTGTGYAGGAPPAAPAPVATREPSAPQRPSGGVTVGLIATGLTLMTFGGLDWAGRYYDWPGNHQAIAFAGTLGMLGLLLLGLGLAGRRSGFPAFLASVAIVATLVTAPLQQNFPLSGSMGQQTWSVSTATLQDSFDHGLGEATLDLRRMEPSELTGRTLTARVGIGQLRVLLPEDVTVHVQAQSSVGDVTIRDAGRSVSTSHSTSGIHATEDVVLGDGDVDVVLDLSVSIGQIVVERN